MTIRDETLAHHRIGQYGSGISMFPGGNQSFEKQVRGGAHSHSLNCGRSRCLPACAPLRLGRPGRTGLRGDADLLNVADGALDNAIDRWFAVALDDHRFEHDLTADDHRSHHSLRT